MREEPPAPPITAANASAPPQPNAQPGAPAAPIAKPFDRKRAEAGARMAVSAIDVAQKVPLRMLANWRMKKLEQKYIPEEAARNLAAKQIITRTLPTSEDEKGNQNYLEKLINKRMSLHQSIELSEQQRNDITSVITTYEEVTGKVLSPEIMLFSSIFGILGGNIYRVFTADINIAEK